MLVLENLERVEYIPLKDWKYGNAEGSYNALTDTIYILLSDQNRMERALQHELFHRSRRNKLTFRLAMLIKSPLIRFLMVLFLMYSLVTGLLQGLSGSVNPDFSPFFAMSFIYLLTLGSKKYEERLAWRHGK